MSLVGNAAPDMSALAAGSVTAAASVIADIKQKAAIMRSLETKMLEAFDAYEQAKNVYEHYRDTVVVASMQATGMTRIEDENGFVEMKTEFYLSPNKNPDDQKRIIEWMTKHGGDHLIKKEIKVAEDKAKALKEAGIPFVEDASFNTTSLKSFIKDLLGLKKGSGAAKITQDEIPECAHWVGVPKITAG